MGRGPADGRRLNAIPSLLELVTSDHVLHILPGLFFVAGALVTKADADGRAR